MSQNLDEMRSESKTRKGLFYQAGKMNLIHLEWLNFPLKTYKVTKYMFSMC